MLTASWRVMLPLSISPVNHVWNSAYIRKEWRSRGVEGWREGGREGGRGAWGYSSSCNFVFPKKVSSVSNRPRQMMSHVKN